VKYTLTLVVLVGCGATHIDAAGIEATTLSSGLVAHWTFNETEGELLADDSGNRRDGIVSGAAFSSDGRFAGALHFVPGDSVTVERFPYATPNWSFSAWVRVGEEDIPSDDFGTVVSTELMQEGGWQLQTRACSSGIYWTFAYWIGGAAQYAHFECECFEFGRWSHAAVVVDATQNLLSFYVDGKLAQSDAAPAAIAPGSSDLFMGKWAGEGRLFSGSLDDVAIYDRALLPVEVAELSTRSPTPNK
jgi:hypothetical protein